MKRYYYVVRDKKGRIITLLKKETDDPTFDFWQFLQKEAALYPDNYIIEPIARDSPAYDLAEYYTETWNEKNEIEEAYDAAAECIDVIAAIIDQWREHNG